MGLTEKQKQTLEIMRADNTRAGFPFTHTEFWQREVEVFQEIFDHLGINSVEDEYFNTRFHGIQPNDPRLYTWFLTIFYKHLQARDSLGLLKRLTSNLKIDPANGIAIEGVPVSIGYPVLVDGREVSADLLFSIYDFYNMLELVPGLASEPVVVGDLGAGWGRIGYVLLHVNPLASYMIFDIPESLLISSCYLPRVCPGFSSSSYEESRGIELSRERILSKRMWFLGAQDITRLQPSSVDVIVNVASFQEMPNEQVNRYLELFTVPAMGGHVYLRNAKENVSSYNGYVIPKGWKQQYDRNLAFCDDFYEAGFNVAA